MILWFCQFFHSRVRPLSEQEQKRGDKSVVTVQSPSSLLVSVYITVTFTCISNKVKPSQDCGAEYAQGRVYGKCVL